MSKGLVKKCCNYQKAKKKGDVKYFPVFPSLAVIIGLLSKTFKGVVRLKNQDFFYRLIILYSKKYFQQTKYRFT